MELITSQLPAKVYCAYLRQKLDSPFYLLDERMNGIVIGPFFSLAHHAQWEWNRRITSECNRAWGFVREKNGVTEVRFIRGKGMLTPFWVMIYTVVFAFLCHMELQMTSGWIWVVGFVVSLIVCGFTAIEDSITENGISGEGEITRFLRNPKEYYC